MICFHSGCREPAICERQLRMLGGPIRSLGFFCLKHSTVGYETPPIKPSVKPPTVPAYVPPEGPPKDSPGWLYDDARHEFVQPASYEQRALFEKQGYISHPLDRNTTRPRRLTIKTRK